MRPFTGGPRRRSHAVPLGADRARGGPRRIAALALVVIFAGLGLTGVSQMLAVPELRAVVPPLAPPLEGTRPGPDPEDAADPVTGSTTDEPGAVEAAGAKVALGDPPGWIRLPKPEMPEEPRRVGIQAGHWLTQDAPPELSRLIQQTGTSWNGVTEWETNLDIAERTASVLRGNGIEVDVLPTVIPPGYLADAFISLHSDGDGVGAKSGFKLAHGARRTPHEDALQRFVTEEYGAATGLAFDSLGLTPGMRSYFAFSWSRVRNATSPFTPSVILEMGFLSNAHDRSLIVNEPQMLAESIASGIMKFLDATPREALFGQDLVVPPPPARRSPSPSPSPQ